MATSSVDSSRTELRTPHSGNANVHRNEPRRNFPHNYYNRRRDGAGPSRGGGNAHNRRGPPTSKKHMLSLDECEHLLAGVP
uniref:Reverse transcriptase domain-containing protein n=1 Tax=Ascaris lumbricoides TaxID=6252 RepID=A0A0M3IWR7_ASCLU